MSLSTTITWIALPDSIERPALLDGRSTPGELIRLTNRMRGHANGVYEVTIPFETPGLNNDTVYTVWQAQLQDTEVWYAISEVVVTSGTGTGALWRTEALITRTGATVTIQDDTDVHHFNTATLLNFSSGWGTSNLYAQFNLKDDTALPGHWLITLRILSVPRSF